MDIYKNAEILRVVVYKGVDILKLDYMGGTFVKYIFRGCI